MFAVLVNLWELFCNGVHRQIEQRAENVLRTAELAQLLLWPIELELQKQQPVFLRSTAVHCLPICMLTLVCSTFFGVSASYFTYSWIPPRSNSLAVGSNGRHPDDVRGNIWKKLSKTSHYPRVYGKNRRGSTTAHISTWLACHQPAYYPHTDRSVCQPHYLYVTLCSHHLSFFFSCRRTPDLGFLRGINWH